MTVAMPSGYQDPELTTPARPLNSMRRTSHVDIIFEPDGLRLVGAARDLETTQAETTVRGTASMTAVIDKAHRVVELRTDPIDSRVESLVGLGATQGFRAALEQLLPDHRLAASPLYLLLDEIPVTTVISGYASLYNNEISHSAPDVSSLKGDICAGWRSDGTMMVSLRTHGAMPIPVGPPANDLLPADDALSWH